MLSWMRDYQVLLYGLTGGSLALLAISLFVTPLVVARLPHDYFSRGRPTRGARSRWRVLIQMGRNAAGGLLIAVGLPMLVLPGPGILTVLAGFLLLDFPGKHAAQSWIVRRPGMLSAMNWIRSRAGRAPLLMGPSITS